MSIRDWSLGLLSGCCCCKPAAHGSVSLSMVECWFMIIALCPFPSVKCMSYVRSIFTMGTVVGMMVDRNNERQGRVERNFVEM